jgi:hypothetical protein
MHHLPGSVRAQYEKNSYGVEVEVENLRDYSNYRASENIPHKAGRELVAMAWRCVGDGSLRNDGAEFVSPPEIAHVILAGAQHLWMLHDLKVWRPSVRTGIHIHCNHLLHTPEELRDTLTRYCLVEPVLFAVVGQSREQSVYCVPWYLGRDEPRVAARALEPMLDGSGRFTIGHIRQACKYSALYIGPLMTYGTIEFRHAPTFDTYADFSRWFRCVRRVVEIGDNPLERWTALGPEGYYREVFGDLPPMLMKQALLTAEKYDVEAIAAQFQPCTYKVPASEWGTPASMRLEKPAPKEYKSRVLSYAVRMLDNVARDALTIRVRSVNFADESPLTRNADWEEFTNLIDDDDDNVEEA